MAISILDASFDPSQWPIFIWEGNHKATLVIEGLPGGSDGHTNSLKYRGSHCGTKIWRGEIVFGRIRSPDVGIRRSIDDDIVRNR